MVSETDQTSEVVESSSQQAPVQEASGDQGVSASSDDSGSTVKAKDVQKADTPAWKPDYKLKVYDEEKELNDPFLKELIKDAASEKKVKEIAQKFLGFDTVKDRHEKVKTEYHSFKEAATPIINYYNQASQLLAKKDMDGFFELLGMSTDDVLKYAVQKAQEMQLPQEQQQSLAQQRAVQRQNQMLEAQYQSLQQQQMAMATQYRNQELSWVMSRPHVAQVATQFDTKNGPNAFRQLVRKIALAHYADSGGQDLSAEQAVGETLKYIGSLVTPTSANPAQTSAGPALIQQESAPPIIPNVAGKGTSPVRKSVRSIEDLKKKHKELIANG